MIQLNDYRNIIGEEAITAIRNEASKHVGKRVTHINSTYYGGGVVEILNSLVVLMNDLDIKASWRLIKAHNAFFDITKSFHNALQGKKFKLKDKVKEIYLNEIEYNSVLIHPDNYDYTIVHDPQPLALIDFYKKKYGKWIWRCHIDLSNPNKELWDFLRKYVNMYDKAIVSMEQYKQKLRIPQTIIPPSIDPLAVKNIDLGSRRRQKMLKKIDIEMDKPIITQVSRFDPWKDPIGVIKSFKKVREKHNCQLVLLGNLASDDPEGPKIYKQVLKNIEKLDNRFKKDIHIRLNVEDNDRTVNALQTESAVVLQKSLKEGFGLTVTEALWKGTPVIGGNAGGIPLQVLNGKTGYVVDNINQCAKAVSKLLENPKLAEQMGKAGREHVRENFLITRHLMDYLKLFSSFKK